MWERVLADVACRALGSGREEGTGPRVSRTGERREREGERDHSQSVTHPARGGCRQGGRESSMRPRKEWYKQAWPAAPSVTVTIKVCNKLLRQVSLRFSDGSMHSTQISSRQEGFGGERGIRTERGAKRAAWDEEQGMQGARCERKEQPRGANEDDEAKKRVLRRMEMQHSVVHQCRASRDSPLSQNSPLPAQLFRAHSCDRNAADVATVKVRHSGGRQSADPDNAVRLATEDSGDVQAFTLLPAACEPLARTALSRAHRATQGRSTKRLRFEE
jgi:hypothetical protein